MTTPFFNTYEDARYANAYSKLDFPGTYFLAYRDLPEIISKHVRGRTALDFGCGSGRSARFLRRLGFHVVGVDISEQMIERAREADPDGDFRLIEEGDFTQFEPSSFDLVLSAFTFDNIPTMANKVQIFQAIRTMLKNDGRMVNLVSSPDIYVHEWASFSTRDFPGNRFARSGDSVRIINTELEDKRPVEDVLWTDESYKEVYRQAGLEIVDAYRPLGRDDEPYRWVNETRIAPWVIYVLKKV